MTTAEVVARTMLDEHAEFLRKAVAMVSAQLMEAEIAAEIGAGRGEVSTGRMADGKVELAVVAAVFAAVGA